MLKAIGHSSLVLGLVLSVASGCGSKSFRGSGAQVPKQAEVPVEKAPPPAEAPKGPYTSGTPAAVLPDEPPKVVQQVVQQQVDVCAGNNLQSDQIRVFIPRNTGTRCQWGVNGNNGSKNASLAARDERSFAINVPQGRTICRMSAQSQSQLMRYDDHLVLTLNNNVLLSSTTEVTRLDVGSNNFRQYNWEKLKDGSTRDERFCAEGVSCELPRTEQNGVFSFSLSNEASSRLFGSLGNQSLSFGLIVTGDNDPSKDCQLYTDIELNVSYTYVGG
jgi:hypothetical protein